MTRSSRAGAAWLLVSVALNAPAAAQPAPAPAPSGNATGSAASASTADGARALYVEGKALRDAGDLQKSLEKLQAAHALYATPITALEVGRAFALVGRLTKAVEMLGTVPRLPVRPNESQKAKESRKEAETLLVQYQARLGTLVLKVPSGGDVKVMVDGVAVPSSAFLATADTSLVEARWPVDPGAHNVAAERGEDKTSDDVRVAEGEQRAVTPHFAPPTPPVPVVVPEPVKPPPDTTQPPVVVHPPILPPPETPKDSGFPTYGYVGFGVGGAGLILGTITGLVTMSRASDIKAACSPNGDCPSSAGLDGARTLGTVSTISFVVAGAGIVLGVIALISSASSSSSPSRAASTQFRGVAW
jgi:hypothetical protein